MTLRDDIVRAGLRLLRSSGRYCDQLLRGPEPPTATLERLLAHAARNVPYYRERLSLDGDLLAQFKRLPPLTKDQIRVHFEDLKSEDLGRRRWVTNSSGGSTGRPITLVQDRDAYDWRRATVHYYFRRFLDADDVMDPKVVLWGSERDIFRQRDPKRRLYDWATRTTFLNSFRMSDARMADYVAAIDAARPAYVQGYAGSLYELARFATAKGLGIRPPRFVQSAAEALRPHMREVVERAFGCRAYDFYGSREVGPIAGEASDGKLYVFDFHNHVEIVDARGEPVPPGGEGRVLVTTLHTYSMPLLRYDIGDTAVRSRQPGALFELPTLDRVTGRVTDHFVTATGELVHGEYLTHLFYFQDWLKEFQVLQTEVDRVEIWFVPVPGTALRAPARAALEAKIRLVLGERCRIAWRPVDEVPRTPQGKLLYTRSLVSRKPEWDRA